MRIKRIISLFLILCMVITMGLFAPSAKAATVASGTCGASAAWELQSDGVLRITGTGAMSNYSSGNAPWYAYRYQIRKIVFDDGITAIGNNAFWNLRVVEAVDFPTELTKIGSNAFRFCTSLESTDLHDKVVTIDYMAFQGCTGLVSVDLPEGLKTIGQWTFSGCTELESICLPTSLTSLGSGALETCHKIRRITIPEGIKSINAWLFHDATALEEIVLHDGITSIGQEAFYGCTRLKRIVFEGNAPSFSSKVFYLVAADAYYPEGNTTWTESVRKNYDGTLTWKPYSEPGDIAPLPDTPPVSVDPWSGTIGANISWTLSDEDILTISGSGAMNNYADGKAPWNGMRFSVKHVKIGEGITQIGSSTFYDCMALDNVTFPETVISIGNRAFYDCSRLTGITLNDAVKSIGSEAFSGCVKMSYFNAGRDLATIGSKAFANCVNLSTLTFRGDAPSIGTDAFSGVTATAYYPADNATWTEAVRKDYGGSITWVSYTPEESKAYDIRYFFGWNENEQRVYFGPEDTLGCLVTEETDNDFRENVNILLDHYVRVETKMVDDREILLSMEEIPTNVGTVTKLNETQITIEGLNYVISDDLHVSAACLNQKVRYHHDDRTLIGLEVLQQKTGFLTYWSTGGRTLRIQTSETSNDGKVYWLYEYATETSQIFLDDWVGTDKATDVTVNYLVDSNRQIFDILPYVEHREGGFSAEEHGWPLANHWDSFGYSKDYAIDPWIYYTHGVDVGSIFQEKLKTLFNVQWGGSCFGLSLLAVAHYNGQLDLSPYFSHTGEHLNAFGYSSTHQGDDGSIWYALYDYENGQMVSNPVVLKIEQAQSSQMSWEIIRAEKEYGPGEYHKLLDHLNSDNPTPLVISMGGHTVVTDTTQKPFYVGNGQYAVLLYDCNAPNAPEELQKLRSWYSNGPAVLLLDMEKECWKYWCYGKWEKEGISAEENDIRVLDVTDLKNDFFDNHYAFNSEQFMVVADLGVAEKPLKIQIFRIDASTGKRVLVFEIVNGVPTVWAEEVAYKDYDGMLVDGTEKSRAILTLPLDDYVIETDGEAYLQCMYDNNIFVAQADKGIELGMDTANDRMTIVAAEDGTSVSGVHASSEVDFATSVEAVMGSTDALTLSADTESKTAEVTTTVDADSVTINHAVDGELEEVSPDMFHQYEVVVTEPTCQTQGVTTYTCTDCGDSYISNYTAPVDHVYVDGRCKWCGKSEPTAKFTTISTSLGGNIAMNFYVELSEDLVSDPEAYIQFTFAGRTVNVPLSEGVLSGKTYRYSCPITSKNMTDQITAQVYNGSGPVGESKTMDVATYCNWVIANYTDAKTVNLMKAMLNYGASAQMLFNYRTDDLANAALAEADKVLGKVDASAYIHSRTGEEEGIKPDNYTLLLDSETTVRVYFKLTGDKTIDEYTFTVDGVEVTPVYKDGLYYIQKTDIGAHRLDELHVFTCGDITITYGGLSYVNQVMTYYTEGTTFDMASALFAYSKAAEAYIG